MLVRSENPVWSFVDLQGNQLDDTYYMFVLNNSIPYIPTPIYQDPNGNIPWMDPIQFLANGTLPDNMYWDNTMVYRLEIRQGDDQSDQLIYLIENYLPPSSGSGPTPPSEVNITTTNQITNPQFEQINFTSPFTTSAAAIDIGPGWTLQLSGGSGSTTVSQVTFTGSSNLPTNPSYALNVVSNGWSTVKLVQQFNNNGALWASSPTSPSYVSMSLTANCSPSGSMLNISSSLVSSASMTPVATILSATLTNTYTQEQGSGQIPVSADTTPVATAYTQCVIQWAGNSNVTITSIQLLGQDSANNVEYEQETLERQADQTFHYYQPLLNFKPIPSFLTAWDFQTNPFQFGTSGNITAGTPAYICDQTIGIATTNTVGWSVGTAPNLNNLVVNTGTSAGIFAFMQYLTDQQVLDILYSPELSVNVLANCDSSAVTVRNYLCVGNGSATIPNLATPTIIGTLNVDGTFTLTAANWTPVPRTQYTDTVGTITPTFQDIGGNGWIPNNTQVTTGVIFAMVTTFYVASPGAGNVYVSSISLVPGSIPTRPAPQCASDVLAECQHYYETSYYPGVAPGTTNQAGYQLFPMQYTWVTTNTTGPVGTWYVDAISFTVPYKVTKRAAPTVTIWPTTGVSPSAGSVQYQKIINGAFTESPIAISGFWNIDSFTNGIVFSAQGNQIDTGSNAGVGGGYLKQVTQVNLQYVSDARLGLV